jgi:hypothetical protein
MLFLDSPTQDAVTCSLEDGEDDDGEGSSAEADASQPIAHADGEELEQVEDGELVDG